MEDQSAPIPEEGTSKLGGIIEMNGGRLMRAFEGNPYHSLREQGRAQRGITRSEDELYDSQ
jgi:hypothetical protein